MYNRTERKRDIEEIYSAGDVPVLFINEYTGIQRINSIPPYRLLQNDNSKLWYRFVDSMSDIYIFNKHLDN
jgi:hypothetical protein